MIVGATLGTGRARISVHTRVDTLRVLALLLRRAIAVTTTTDHVAPLIWITAISASAPTLCLVSGHVALSVLPARIGDEARVHTDTVDTRFVQVALTVRSTADRSTSRLWVALVAWLATAHGSMIVYVAFRIKTAIARISALPIDASLRSGTLRIAFTTWVALQHYLSALTIDVGYPQFRTFANHSPYWHTVKHGALGSRIAWLKFSAWVFATAVQACQTVGTVGVGHAFRLIGHWCSTLAIR